MPIKTNPPKKILFVLEHFHPYIGGAEKLFKVLTVGLANKGFEVVVVTTKFDKELPSEEIFEGVKIIRVNCFNRFAFTIFSLPKVFRYALEADFIHTTTYNAALPASLVGRLLSKPVFVTFHEVWGDLWQRLPFTTFLQKTGFYNFEKMLLRLPFNRFIAVSNFTKNELIKNGIAPEKIIRIYNGIDYDLFKKFSHSPPPVFTFTYFGRLGISKGLNLLIPAAARFRKDFPNSKLKLIVPKYPAPLYQKIMALIEKYDLKNYIEFHHNLPRQKLYEELLNSSCVVISSYSEGFCFAAAEAVALGVPIITSGQGALTETVTGKFIEMDDMSVRSLSDALAKAYQNQWTETEVRQFYLSESVEEYVRFYEDEF